VASHSASSTELWAADATEAANRMEMRKAEQQIFLSFLSLSYSHQVFLQTK
jgi:hypothetical protein